jgi:hypothetical protein
VTCLENEHEKKNIDPAPNQTADLATFLHITNSTILSQRPFNSRAVTVECLAKLKQTSYITIKTQEQENI